MSTHSVQTWNDEITERGGEDRTLASRDQNIILNPTCRQNNSGTALYAVSAVERPEFSENDLKLLIKEHHCQEALDIKRPSHLPIHKELNCANNQYIWLNIWAFLSVNVNLPSFNILYFCYAVYAFQGFPQNYNNVACLSYVFGTQPKSSWKKWSVNTKEAKIRDLWLFHCIN